MTQRRTIILGFALASAIPALILATLAVISQPSNRAEGLLEAALLLATSFLVFFPYSAFFTLLLGVPAFLICRRFGFVTWWAALIGGILVGIVVSVIERRTNQPYTPTLLRYVPAAAIAALAFWFVWRPGRDQQRNPAKWPTT